MPELSYDALTNLLIFLVGVPTLVLQTADQEVRRVIMRRLLRDTAPPFVLAVIIVGIGLAQEAALLPLEDAHQIPVILFGSIGVAFTKGNIALVVMSLLVLLSLYATLLATQRYGRRESVIRQLENEAGQNLSEPPPWHTQFKIGMCQVVQAAARRLPQQPPALAQFKRWALRASEPTLIPNHKRPRLAAKPLEDLIELGEQSAPGENKEWVLKALGKLVAQVTKHPRYQGDSLEGLTTKLVDILTSAAQPGAARNFGTAADILRHSVTTASAQPSAVDLMYTIRALGHLGRAALDHVSSNLVIEHILLDCVGALGLAANLDPSATNQASEELFKLGALLLEREQEFVAVSALDALLNLVWENAPAQGELVHDTLGLAAHFWTHGATAKEYVGGKLATLRPYLALDLQEALQEARAHCTTTMYFQAADHLQQVMKEL